MSHPSYTGYDLSNSYPEDDFMVISDNPVKRNTTYAGFAAKLLLGLAFTAVFYLLAVALLLV